MRKNRNYSRYSEDFIVRGVYLGAQRVRKRVVMYLVTIKIQDMTKKIGLNTHFRPFSLIK